MEFPSKCIEFELQVVHGRKGHVLSGVFSLEPIGRLATQVWLLVTGFWGQGWELVTPLGDWETPSAGVISYSKMALAQIELILAGWGGWGSSQKSFQPY